MKFYVTENFINLGIEKEILCYALLKKRERLFKKNWEDRKIKYENNFRSP